jgi:hypothetical protein
VEGQKGGTGAGLRVRYYGAGWKLDLDQMGELGVDRSVLVYGLVVNEVQLGLAWWSP